MAPDDYTIETIVPVRANMDLHADASGLTRLGDFVWDPTCVPAEPSRRKRRPPKPGSLVQMFMPARAAFCQSPCEKWPLVGRLVLFCEPFGEIV